jgi:protein involved in polysaccharide export with SLBB domain
VSEAIQAAGGFLTGADQRNIRITRRDSTIVRADLLPFLLAGDLGENPRLEDGDVILVGPRENDIQFLGALRYPGRYPYVEGDELSELLSWVGLHPRASTSRAMLQRFRDGVRWDTLGVDLESVLAGVSRIPLQAGDRVLIASIGDWQTGSTAEVRGAVAFPGPIPLERGKITAAQAVAMAGGFLDDAVASRVVLAKPFLPDTSGVPDPIGSESYLTAVTRSQLHERVVDLTEGSGPILDTGDILFVPRLEPWVQVLGQVKNPGFYIYYPEWGVMDYIRAAGGYGKFADGGKTQISKGRFGDIGYASDVDTLAPGDLVWVPEKISRGFWNNFKDVIQVAGQAAALILVAREITR